MIFGFIRYDFLLVPINSTLCYFFRRFDIILKNLRTLLYLFYSLSFNFIIFHSRVTSIWYHNLTSIRDRLCLF